MSTATSTGSAGLVEGIVAAFREGRTAAALTAARRALADRPGGHDLQRLMALGHHRADDFAAAEIAARRAAASGDTSADAQVLIGVAAQAAGAPDRAVAAFDRALGAPTAPASARQLRASALIELGRYDEAWEELLAYLVEHRGSLWWPDSLVGTAAEPADGDVQVSALKLRHDLEQLKHLDVQGRLPPGAASMIGAFGEVLAEIGDDPTIGAQVTRLDERQRWRIGAAYNKIVVLDPGKRVAGSALATSWDRQAAARSFAKERVAVVDGLLRPEALAALRRFCLDSTIWFDTGHALGNRGYIGADGIAGFGCPLVFQIAEDLRAALPGIIGDLPLIKLWAFKYDHSLQGINAHADAARVNVNFWITPDDANLSANTGGLLVWNTHIPSEWGFDVFNNDSEALLRRAKEVGAAPLAVSHRQNRAVIFDSDLIHATAPLHFREGYENRRINVTLLYGRRRGAS